MTVSKVVKSAAIVCIEPRNWMVSGQKEDGGGVNFGNFKTSAEAKCVSDFINSAIANGIEVDSIRQLSDVLDSLTGRVK